MSGTEQRTAAMARVTEARTALNRLFTSAAEKPPLGPHAEASHLQLLIDAWSELGDACRAAAQGFRQPSPPFVDLMNQHTKATEHVTRLRVDLVGKQAEVEQLQARLRGER